MLHRQEDLFAIRGPLAVDATFANAQRTELDARSWVEVVPGWISGAEQLFDALSTAVSWSQHYRKLFEQTFLEPRLTSEYRSLHNVPHAALLTAVAALSSHYGVGYDSLWLNLYRDGRDSTGWHRDRSEGRWCFARFLAAIRRPDRHGRSLPGRLGPRRAEVAGHARAANQRQFPKLGTGATPALACLSVDWRNAGTAPACVRMPDERPR